MAVKKVEVPDLGAVHLYKRRGASGMRLSITSQGIVRVSLPHWLPFKSGIDFAKQKQQWILEQRVPPPVLKHGYRVGKSSRLVFVADGLKQRPASRIAVSGEIRIYHPPHLSPDDQTVQSIAEKACIRSLKSQAEALLPQRLDNLAGRHGFSYQNVRVKQLKSRWGSCTEQKEITLSCFLMQLPWHLIDYVLLHELTHTRVMAHGPKFWSEMDKYVSNLKEIRREIKNHRPAITPV